jgi:septal ring factor EnvC (AmiA/AmiB activator)
MNSTPTPNATEPHDAPIARPDERLAQAHEQIKSADEQLARLSEQLAKIERDAARPSSAVPGQRSLSGRPALQVLVGLSLAACFIVAGLVWHSFYGGGTKLVVALGAPQVVSTTALPPENTPLPEQPAASSVQLAAAEAAPPQATPLAQTTTAQTTAQDAAPAATAALPDQTQLLQTMARDLANLERSIEQLKASQQQMASDNSKAIEELKASQEEIRRVLARVSEQNVSKASPPPTQPAPTLRKPERTPQSSQARTRPRYYPREWMYDDW